MNGIKITLLGIRRFTIRGKMDNRGVIDESSQQVPYSGDGNADNIRVDIINNEPVIQLIQYVKKTGVHVDLYAIAANLNLNSVTNLEYLGKLIAEKVSEHKQAEP